MQKEISPFELYQLLDKPGKLVNIDNYYINEGAKFGKLNCLGAVFRNCGFKFNIDFKDVYLTSGLAFKDCTFEKSLMFDNSHASVLEADKWKFNDSITLENTTVKDKLLITNASLNNDFKILKGCEIDRLIIDTFTSNFGRINFESSKVISEFVISQCFLKSSFSIESCQSDAHIRLTNLNTESVTFIKNTFTKDLQMYAGESRTGIFFDGGIYEGDFTIEAVKANQVTKEWTPTLSFYNEATFKKYCAINYFDKNIKDRKGGCPAIYIGSANFENALLVNSEAFPGDDLSPLEQLNIDCSKKLRGELVFNHLKIKKFNLSGASYDCSIIFNRVEFERVKINYFSNFSKLQIVDVSAVKDKNSMLIITNSFLGNAQFSNVDFQSFTDVAITNSDISQILTSCVKWFNETNINRYFQKSEIRGYFQQLYYYWKLKRQKPALFPAVKEATKRRKIKYAIQKRELYRQLKYALEKQGDKIQSLVFKKYEMKAFKEELRLTKKWFSYEKFILWVNQSNDYGQNWLKPALLAFVVTFVFYLVLTASHSDLLLLSPAETMEDVRQTMYVWWNNKKIFVQLLNPAQDMEKMFNDKHPIGFTTYFLSYTHKLILSYLIFQVISAFRKYTAKY